MKLGRLIVIGLIAGWLADELLGDTLGILGNLVIGVVGALVGSWIFDRTGIGAGRRGFLTSTLAAIVGAVLFVLVLKLARGETF